MTWISTEGLLPGRAPCQAHAAQSPTVTDRAIPVVADARATRLPCCSRGMTRQSPHPQLQLTPHTGASAHCRELGPGVDGSIAAGTSLTFRRGYAPFATKGCQPARTTGWHPKPGFHERQQWSGRAPCQAQGARPSKPTCGREGGAHTMGWEVRAPPTPPGWGTVGGQGPLPPKEIKSFSSSATSRVADD